MGSPSDSTPSQQVGIDCHTVIVPDRARHPLSDSDPNECYEIQIAERRLLLQSKKEEEQSLIKQTITLASGALALFAGLVFSKESSINDLTNSTIPVVGITLIIFSITFCLVEQYLSALAYNKQVELNDDYYARRIIDTKNPLGKYISALIAFALASFLIGSALLAWSLLQNFDRRNNAMAEQRPPSPPPPREPGHKSDTPGRSVPPSAPPPPPNRK